MLEGLSVGDKVFIYSIYLDEVIEGKVEGFVGDNKARLKVLQKVSDGYIRHIVSSAYTFKDRDSALMVQSEERKMIAGSDVEFCAGMTVNLLNQGSLVRDDEGYPLLYQIISVYEDQVSLVTSYGELIGKYDKSQIVYHSDTPIFSSKDYEIGQKVTWITNSDVYEGIITHLRSRTARVVNIKKLYPINEKMDIPYYKLSGDLQETAQILTTVIGDNLEN